MSAENVDPFEMAPREPHEPHEIDIDDRVAEELLSGRGRDLDPQLADVLGDVRVAFRSQAPALGTELSALIAGESLEPSPTRRNPRTRSALARRFATATTLALVATGSLAVAGALPAPAQDAAARAAAAVGLDISSGNSGNSHGHS